MEDRNFNGVGKNYIYLIPLDFIYQDVDNNLSIPFLMMPPRLLYLCLSSGVDVLINATTGQAMMTVQQ